MKIYYLPIFLIGCLSVGCNDATQTEESTSPEFTVQNPTDQARTDELVVLDAADLQKQFPDVDWSKVKFTSGDNLPFQANDLDLDGTVDEFALLVNLGPDEEKTIKIETLAEGEKAPEFQKRTQAELSHKVGGEWKDREYMGGQFKNVSYLRVPPEHKDHSWFIRYEGPGWESDLVGYRFYLDQRNATDIFGKKTRDMVLQDVGQDGFDSYHEPAAWGMDVLKVGPSLGIGALGTWMGDKALRVETTDSLSSRVVLNGPVESLIRTMYYGWKVGDVSTTVTSELSIQAGSRLTLHQVSLSEPLPNLCTGIVKHENTTLLQNQEGSWAYLATWGAQSLAEDQLGMAVIYQVAESSEVTEDDNSHVVVLTPTNNEVSYYFLAAWEQEPDGIKSEEAFKAYLNQVLTELNSPATVKL